MNPAASEGYEIFQSYSIDNTYILPEITPERAYKLFTQNIHLVNNITNMISQVFPEKATIEVVDVDTGEPDVELSNRIRIEFQSLKLTEQMRMSWLDCMWAGASVKSVGIKKTGNKYSITEIRHLPAITFRETPTKYSLSYNNPLLPGIVWDESEQRVRAFQTNQNGYSTNELRNFSIVRDPTTPPPGGMSYCLPVYPVVLALNVANQAANQQVMRTGAPLVFPKFEQMNDSMLEWGKEFVKRWGKNVGFTVPPGVEFVDPKIHETDTANERLNMLILWIDSFFNPTTVLESGTGTKIGASDSGAMQIWNNFISGTQAWIEEQFEELLNPVLVANGYVNKQLSIRLKRPTLDKSKEVRNQVLAAVKAKAITKEEIRRNLSELKFDDFTPEIEAKLNEEYKNPVELGSFGNVADLFGKGEKIIRETEKKLNAARKKAYEEIYGII